MSAASWMEIYRAYSVDELAAEIASLRTQKSVFTSQATGSKSFTLDVNTLGDQLQAAARVQNERKNANTPLSGTVDFSGMDPVS